MTPSEQWILGLFAVYAIPSFLLGVGLTLACVHWWGRQLLSPQRMFAAVESAPSVTTGRLPRAI